MAVHDKPSAGPQRAEGAQRRLAAEPVEHDVDAVSGELAHPRQEVLVAVVDRHRAEPLHRGTVAGEAGPVHAKPGDRAELEDRGAHPAGRAVHEHRLAALDLRRAVKQLVGGHVGEHEAHDLGRVEVLGTSTAFASGTQTRSASAPHTVSAPMRSPTFSLEQPGPSSSTTPTSS